MLANSVATIAAAAGLIATSCWPCASGRAALDVTLSLATGLKPQSMWGEPMWTFVPAVLCYFAAKAASETTCKLVVRRCAVIGSLLAALVVAKNTALPYLSGKPARVHFPGGELAAVVEERWQHEAGGPLTVVSGAWWAAGNVGLHLDGNVAVYDFFRPDWSPWCSDEQLRASGGVIVFDADSFPYLDKELPRRFPDARVLPEVELPWQTGAAIKPARFRVAIVPPRASHVAKSTLASESTR